MILLLGFVINQTETSVCISNCILTKLLILTNSTFPMLLNAPCTRTQNISVDAW